MRVTGNCPMGCGEGLILGEGGVLWCPGLLCPRPTAAAEILADDEAQHIVTIDPDGFAMRHPLRERLDDALLTCTLHEYLASQRGPVPGPGCYRVTDTGTHPDIPGARWVWLLLPT